MPTGWQSGMAAALCCGTGFERGRGACASDCAEASTTGGSATGMAAADKPCIASSTLANNGKKYLLTMVLA
jgi:hypothetical protein